jgi:hypothetical protein
MGIPVEHCPLLWIPGVRLVQPYDFVASFGIDENDDGGVLWLWHLIDILDLHTDYVSIAAIPGNRLTLANVTKEMMFRTKSHLLNLQVERRPLCFDSTQECNDENAKHSCRDPSGPPEQDASILHENSRLHFTHATESVDIFGLYRKPTSLRHRQRMFFPSATDFVRIVCLTSDMKRCEDYRSVRIKSQSPGHRIHCPVLHPSRHDARIDQEQTQATER